MEKQYIISEELDLPNNTPEGLIKRKNITTFREGLDDDLRNLGKNTYWVNSDLLSSGIKKYLTKSSLPIVSLDDRYVTSADYFLGISRGVDRRLNDVGYVSRVGYRRVNEQLDRIAALGKEIILADDVIFSGEMIEAVRNQLERRDIKIGGVICGIVIQEGLERLASMNIPIEAVQSFDDVEDELCERDFAVVPGSGRRVDELDMNALYFDPTYGKPSAWASLPSNSIDDFTTRNYRRSAYLLQPNTPLDSIGKFYGLQPGDAKESLKIAAARTERVIS